MANQITFDAASSSLGPLNMEVGADKTRTFKVKIVVGPNAPDVKFHIMLAVSMETGPLLLAPDPTCSIP